MGKRGTRPVPWQNITTLVSLSSRSGGSPNGPRALILGKVTFAVIKLPIYQYTNIYRNSYINQSGGSPNGPQALILAKGLAKVGRHLEPTTQS